VSRHRCQLGCADGGDANTRVRGKTSWASRPVPDQLAPPLSLHSRPDASRLTSRTNRAHRCKSMTAATWPHACAVAHSQRMCWEAHCSAILLPVMLSRSVR